MELSRAQTWLSEPPQNNVTLSGLLRRDWPGFANVVLLAKQLDLGRAARLVERVILGAMGGFIYYGGLPLGSLGKVSGLTDGLELAAIVKVIAILAGWAVQFSLKSSRTRSTSSAGAWRPHRRLDDPGVRHLRADRPGTRRLPGGDVLPSV